MITARHTHVDQDLVSEIFDKMHGGHSAVVLGHRYNGKTVLIRHLRTRLERAGFAVERISGEKLDAEARSGRAEPRAAEHQFDDWLEKHEGRKSWVLIASDVDALPAASARGLLERIRTRADCGRLVALVTGQLDLRNHIQGPKAELTNFDHYLAQGLSEAESARFAADLLREVHLPPDFEGAAQDVIWRLAGGNTFLMRSILWATSERRNKGNPDAASGPVTADEILESVEKFSFDASEYMVTNAERLIQRDAECWPRLESLITSGQAPIAHNVTMGGALTLSGVAVRRDDTLYWASELMKRLILRRFYPVSKIADLYARGGKWAEAFAKYETLIGTPQPRPYNRDDYADVVANVDALAASLYVEAAKGIQATRSRFADGCRWLLGIPEVHFWKWTGGWKHDLTSPARLSPAVSGAALEILPDDMQAGFSVPQHWAYCVAGKTLTGVRPDLREAVLLGDFETREPLAERQKLLDRLLPHFVAAHDHAVAAERAKQRLQTRNRHSLIVTSIHEAMGTDFTDVGQVIGKASTSLRELGYEHVRFHLVDSDRQKIQLVPASADDGAKWDDAEIDLEPPEGVELASHAQVVRSGIAFTGPGHAIVPIKKYTVDENWTVGTIQVVRRDKLTPSIEEVSDLEIFANQLSTAIRYGERVQLIQSTLDRIPDPVMIFDAQSRLRYANEIGLALFGVNPQWRSPTEIPPEVAADAQRALQQGTSFRHVETVTGVSYKGDLTSRRIEDWRGDHSGGFLHLHDLNDFYRVANALGHVAQATDQTSAIDRLMEALTTGGLCHPWVRVYFVDPEDKSKLRSERGYGFAQVDAFNRRKTCLIEGQTAGGRGWRCINDQKPLLYCYRPDPDADEFTEGSTPLGIPMYWVNINDTDPVIRKKPGDMWLDFPLITPANQVLGKVTVGCDAKLSRQEYEGLFVLSGWLAGVIFAFSERDRLVKERQEWVEASAKLSMATMAHSMNTQFASLGLLVERYRRRRAANGDLFELTGELEDLYGRLTMIATDANRKLGVVTPKWETFNLVAVLRRVCALQLAEHQWRLSTFSPEYMVHAEERLVVEVVDELLTNARKAKLSTGSSFDDLRVSVRIEESDKYVVVTLQDNGPGVPPEYRPKIFDAYFRVYTGAAQEGQGLGLSRAKEVITAHGGTIDEVGESGGGARFVIALLRNPPAALAAMNVEVGSV